MPYCHITYTPGCPLCERARSDPAFAAAIARAPARIPQIPQPMIRRVRYCPNRKAWDWAVIENGRVVAQGSEVSEELAREETMHYGGGMLWSYGVTTIPERQELLSKTLVSLTAAGFDKPRLFIDGAESDSRWVSYKYGTEGDRQSLPCTTRYPRIGAWGNWILALYELYIRNPTCERFAIFQDDVLAVKNLRHYLDSCHYPDGRDGRAPGFWNLVTMRSSEWEIKDRGPKCGWIEGACLSGNDPSNRLQKCAGALGLVFNRQAAGIILSARSSILKPISTDTPRHNIDGAVVTVMNLHRHDPVSGERWPHGWREYVHGPSLLRHEGAHSACRPGKEWTTNAETWPGEVDIVEFMKG